MKIPADRDPHEGYVLWVPVDENDIKFYCCYCENLTELEDMLLALLPDERKRCSVQREVSVSMIITASKVQ